MAIAQYCFAGLEVAKGGFMRLRDALAGLEHDALGIDNNSDVVPRMNGNQHWLPSL
jgi:hypothetical protein